MNRIVVALQHAIITLHVRGWSQRKRPARDLLYDR